MNLTTKTMLGMGAAVVMTVCVGMAQPAQAVLLVTVNGDSGGGTTPTSEATDVTLFLGFDFSFSSIDFNNPLGNFVPENLIGLDFKIPLNTLLPFSRVFTTIDSGFDNVTARLTNGLDELFFVGELALQPSGELTSPSSTVTSLESYRFGVLTDLIGNTITSIELEVTQIDYNFNPTTNGSQLDLDAVWRINGYATDLGAVPEPVTAALGLMGFGVLGMAMRRRAG